MMSYSTNPGYIDLLVDMKSSLELYNNDELWQNYTFPDGFFADLKKFYYFENKDYLLIFYIGIICTIARYLFERFLCRPFINAIKMDEKSSRDKFPESAWKFVFYSMTWSYVAYLLIFSGRYDYFTKPWLIWDDWEIGMPVPDDVTLIYFVECGFYLHSIYATLYMDTFRKDFWVMIVHHVLTMTLILFSYATRYHKIGLNVLFVHDITDILLEFTKINVYLKKRNGKFYAMHEHVSNIGFALFTLAWYIFRLYWFPLKVLYSSGVVAVHTAFHRGAGLYIFFNGLLWLLLCLDIYWFYFVLLFLFKVATGQMNEINDTREYEADKNKVNKKKE